GCPVDCSYCYLQTYSNAPGLILPANIEDYYSRITELDNKAVAGIRIGTGEFTDSLALDKYTRYASKLIPFFKNMKNLVLELKTKIADISHVIQEQPHENVVISWSINTKEISDMYEKGASSVKGRIKAAKEAAKKGFKIGFHFDPIVFYREWEKEYEDIVNYLFSFDEIKEQTVWISLGSLRYTPGLKQIAEKRFGKNTMFYEGEFFEDIDGKFRYPEHLRVNMYKKMNKWIKKYNNSCWVYLCMEPESVWNKAGVKV
ncbi:MAG: spore photoproduct lyase family protein, partial [Candidatus Omnitrophota bacterium]